MYTLHTKPYFNLFYSILSLDKREFLYSLHKGIQYTYSIEIGLTHMIVKEIVHFTYSSTSLLIAPNSISLQFDGVNFIL